MGNYRLGIETNAGYGTYLAHHGIKGQKWGVRRFQNPDGTLTEEGKRRYLDSTTGEANHKKLVDASDREWNENGHGNKYKEITESQSKYIQQLHDSAAELSGVREANRKRQEAQDRKYYNWNPFKIKQLNQEYDAAEKERQKASKKFIEIFSDMSIDYIDSIPKDQREDAMRYAALWMYH